MSDMGRLKHLRSARPRSFRTVILISDDENTYRLPAEVYTALTGRAPKEGTMLDARIENGTVTSAVYSDAETERRLAEARAWLERMKNRRKS